MKILVDTNVILDVLLHREPYFHDSRRVYELVEQRACIGCVSSSAMTDIFFIARKELKDTALLYRLMDVLCEDFTIAPVRESTIRGALAFRWKDFEDAVQYMTAQENGVDSIVTRSAGDFEHADVACMSPAEFLSHFKNNPDSHPSLSSG